MHNFKIKINLIFNWYWISSEQTYVHQGHWCKGGNLITHYYVSFAFAYFIKISNFASNFNCMLIVGPYITMWLKSWYYNDIVDDLAMGVLV